MLNGNAEPATEASEHLLEEPITALCDWRNLFSGLLCSERWLGVLTVVLFSHKNRFMKVLGCFNHFTVTTTWQAGSCGRCEDAGIRSPYGKAECSRGGSLECSVFRINRNEPFALGSRLGLMVLMVLKPSLVPEGSTVELRLAKVFDFHPSAGKTVKPMDHFAVTVK